MRKTLKARGGPRRRRRRRRRLDRRSGPPGRPARCRAPRTATGRTTPPTCAAPSTRRSIRSTPPTSTRWKWRGASRPTTSAPAPSSSSKARRWRSRACSTSTAGTRRSVVALDGRTGELIWSHSYREGNRAAIAPRQLSGRGVSYWTDGKGDERILYVTTGYRLIALNAKNGAMIPSFGEGGVVDLKKGAVFGKGQQIDLETGEIGLHSTPTVVKDVDHRRLVVQGRHDGQDPQQHQGSGPRLRREERQAALDVQHDSEAGRVRQRHVGERVVGDQRQHRRVDADHRRRGSRARLPAGRIADLGLLRRPPPGQQPVRREPGVRRPEDRPAQVALPDRPPPDLGLRPVVGADPARHQRRRQADQGGRAAEQGSVPLRVRSHHRPAGVADRRDVRCRSPTCPARRRRRRSRSRPNRRPTRGSRSASTI